MSDPEIVSTRTFAVTPAELYAAFADPERLAQWWGPEGFTNTIHVFELHPGGRWNLTMHGPQGAEYENEKEFLEVAPVEKIVFRHLRPMHTFLMTMEYAAEGDGTRLTWRMRFESPEEVARIQDFIIPKNEENFDRLAAHLAGS